MSNNPKQVLYCLKLVETHIIEIVFDYVPYHAHANIYRFSLSRYINQVPELLNLGLWLYIRTHFSSQCHFTTQTKPEHDKMLLLLQKSIDYARNTPR